MPTASEVKALYKAFLREGVDRSCFAFLGFLLCREPKEPCSSLYCPEPKPCTTGKKFTNYNVREFVQRKAKVDFRSHAAETDKAVIDQLWTQAKLDLDAARRQALVYSLYGSKQKSVMVISCLLSSCSITGLYPEALDCGAGYPYGESTAEASRGCSIYNSLMAE